MILAIQLGKQLTNCCIFKKKKFAAHIGTITVGISGSKPAWDVQVDEHCLQLHIQWKDGS